MKQLVFLILSLVAATSARSGVLTYEYFDCSPQYKLFSVSWSPPWSQHGQRNLEWNTTNAQATWGVVVYSIAESGCWAPATNMRWYRVKLCGGQGCYPDTNVLWVPQQRCEGAPNSPFESRS